jgi:hypothetical protein
VDVRLPDGAQIVLVLTAALGWLLDRARASRPRLLFAPYYLALGNLASSHAAIKFLRRERHRVWRPRLG